ncbi:MAG: YkgJ family cysteine cluster protein, partial [Candidatus Pacebacteria bacterium]|nr:YkgJ family cysteine cluster protein [Candidatus Paceibacterota bacterium]
KTEGLFHLKRNTLHCPFLKDGQCIVYDARPTQCRTWPFWPDNMNPSTWKKEIESYCPGIGKGKLYSTEEIDVILNEHKKACDNY